MSLLDAPVLRSLAGSSLANLAASLALVSRNLLDGYYAAQLSTTTLAAFTLALPIVFLTIGLSQGLSVAVGNILARRAGRGERADALYVRNAALAAALGGSMLALPLFAALPWLFAAYGADAAVLVPARRFATALLAGMPLLFLYGVATAMLRALGDARAAARATTTGLAFGALLTPLLTFGVGLPQDWALVGIAVGLAAGYAMTTVLVARQLARRGLLVRRGNAARWREDSRAFVRAALPVIGNNLVALAALFVMTGVVAGAGREAVAALGVVSRIEQFALVLMNAVVLALVPFVAQNFAAGRSDRVVSAFGWSTLLMLAGALPVALVLLIANAQIGRVFALPPEGLRVAQSWLALAGVAFFFQGITLAGTGVLQALRRPRLALLITLLRLYALMLPALFWLSANSGAPLWYWAVSGAQILSGSAFLLAAAVFAWRLRTTRVPVPAVG